MLTIHEHCPLSDGVPRPFDLVNGELVSLYQLPEPIAQRAAR